MIALGLAARLGGLLAAALAVVLAWIGMVSLGGGSVAGSVAAVAGSGLLRPESLAAVASGAVPLLLAGLALAIGLRAGLVNLGVQGQALAGALAAVLVEERLRAPAGPLLAVAVVAAVLAGLAWALLPALLRAWRGVPEALTTVLASFVAVAVAAALPLTWQPPPARSPAAIGDLAEPLRQATGGAAWTSLVTWTVPFALLAAIALVLVLRATRVGSRLRALLDEPRAALLAGVRPGVTATAALLLSGAVAGLVGLQDALAHGAPVAGGLGTVAITGVPGVAPLAGAAAFAPVAIAHLPDYGLLAVAVALAGRASGLGMVLAALALALLDRAGAALGPAAGLSPEVVTALQVVLVVAAVLAARVVRGVTASYQARSARQPAPAPDEPSDERVLEPTIDDATEGAHA